MKTLEDHNRERGEIHNEANSKKPVKNGIACPNCGDELLDSSPMNLLLSNPPKKDVHCDSCGFKNYRIA